MTANMFDCPSSVYPMAATIGPLLTKPPTSQLVALSLRQLISQVEGRKIVISDVPVGMTGGIVLMPILSLVLALFCTGARHLGQKMVLYETQNVTR